jgi:hypothetical protein
MVVRRKTALSLSVAGSDDIELLIPLTGSLITLSLYHAFDLASVISNHLEARDERYGRPTFDTDQSVFLHTISQASHLNPECGHV